MSSYSKVAWKEGLFLRQHHFQQADRYVERLLALRTQHLAPYGWGFSTLEIDRGVMDRGKFALSAASGVFQDGTPFDMPDTNHLPAPIDIDDSGAGAIIWLSMPVAIANATEISATEAAKGERYSRHLERVNDTAARSQIEEEIETAHPNVTLDLRKTPKSGSNCIAIAKVAEVQDKAVILDQNFVPPLLAIAAQSGVIGWLDRVIGWVDTRLAELARFAADPGTGGGLAALEYFVLLALNREVNGLKHLRHSRYTHPVEVYQALLRLSGELWTLDDTRLAPDYPVYDHDNLAASFAPVMQDIQRLLSVDLGRAQRLDLTEVGANSFVATVTDRNLFREAAFVIEISASKPLTDIQFQFPDLCKVGPNTRMNDIVNANVPGLALVHLPTPPAQIRRVSDHVYFMVDKNAPLWAEFSTAAGIAFHFAGDWPDLELELWAISEASG